MRIIALSITAILLTTHHSISSEWQFIKEKSDLNGETTYYSLIENQNSALTIQCSQKNNFIVFSFKDDFTKKNIEEVNNKEANPTLLFKTDGSALIKSPAYIAENGVHSQVITGIDLHMVEDIIEAKSKITTGLEVTAQGGKEIIFEESFASSGARESITQLKNSCDSWIFKQKFQ
jgi:hypothetical protein